MAKQIKQIRTDNVSPAQVNHWKIKEKKEGVETEIFRFWVPVTSTTIEIDGANVPSEVAAGYFRKPNLEILGMVSQIGNQDKTRSVEVLFNECWIGGDERIKQRDESRMSAVAQLGPLFKVLETEVEKL